MARVTLEYFSKAKVALGQECILHPELKVLLSKHPASEFELKVAEIANYLGMPLHGDFSPADLDNLCHTMTHKLQQARVSLVAAVNKTRH